MYIARDNEELPQIRNALALSRYKASSKKGEQNNLGMPWFYSK